MKYIYELQEFDHKVLNDHKSEILFAIAERLEHIVDLSSATKQPYKCPCCDGWKQRFRGNGSFLGTTEYGEWVDCVACNATGLVWR